MRKILTNNVGYDLAGPKRAIIAAGQKPNGGFQLLDADTGAVVHHGQLRAAGAVTDWGEETYWVADFSTVAQAGKYVVAVESDRSAPFMIEDVALERYTLSHVTHYFKGSRSSGQFDKFDHDLPIANTGKRFDAHGGWYDATGDFGKHFTQLSNLSYFNTLSIPLTAWTLFGAHRQLTSRADANFTQLETWLLDEAMHGADYLTRVHTPGGSFYSSVSQPGPPKIPTNRSLSTAQVDYREGGGVAIAALAIASTYDVSGDYRNNDYLAAAEDAFGYLEANNQHLTNDGKENILDDYNALLAATELFRTTGKSAYKSSADARAGRLIERLVSWKAYRDYWRADDADRPFFHPSDAGLPVMSLLAYAGITTGATHTRVLRAVRRSLEFELAVSSEVTNPFGYARQLVQDKDGKRYSGFFFPHNVTPRTNDQWWQGENARIASLATAARAAARYFPGDHAFSTALRKYATNQLNWILGTNPFDVCMLDGSGHGNPQYIWLGSWQFLPYGGGIVNGITGQNDDGSGILWNHGYATTGKDDDWRWLEQWLPHASWYMYAVSIGADDAPRPATNTPRK